MDITFHFEKVFFNPTRNLAKFGIFWRFSDFDTIQILQFVNIDHRKTLEVPLAFFCDFCPKKILKLSWIDPASGVHALATTSHLDLFVSSFTEREVHPGESNWTDVWELYTWCHIDRSLLVTAPTIKL